MTYFESETSRTSLKQSADKILANAIDKQANPKSAVNGLIMGLTNEKETVYTNSAGVLNAKTGRPFTKDTIFNFWSTTKAIAVTAVLQLYDKGLLDLDAPAEQYLPEISDLKILTGWTEDNKPILKQPKNKITTRQLITHTAGLSYEFFNGDYAKLKLLVGQPDILQISEKTFENIYLLFEPGTENCYGYNVDFAGFLLEKITGQKLGDYIKENIFTPAAMKTATFEVDESQADKVLVLELRQPDGSLVPSELQPDQKPRFHMGGHGIFGTIEDYLSFIRVWLNEGKTPCGKTIISHKVWQEAIRNNLPDGVTFSDFPSHDPVLTNPLYFDKNKLDSWGLGFAVSEHDLPTGRPKGTIYWCGLANLFFWIDLKNKIGGYYGSQILPFLEASAANSTAFETTVYEHLAK